MLCTQCRILARKRNGVLSVFELSSFGGKKGGGQCLPPKAAHCVSFSNGTESRPPRVDLAESQSHTHKSHRPHVGLDDTVQNDPKAEGARRPDDELLHRAIFGIRP
jgi:hypothetical protein